MSPLFEGIRGVSFDLDDTLCSYWDACKAGLRSAFAQHPVDGFTSTEMIGHWAQAFQLFGRDLKATHWYATYLQTGEPTRTEQMRLTLKGVGVDDLDHARRLSHAYMVERDRELKLFPDAIDVLERIGAHFPLALITNGPADIQRQEIETVGIASYFRTILIEGEMGFGKPHRNVFVRAEHDLGCKAHEMVMVGNSYSHDIFAAHTAGWRTIWIRRASDVPPSAANGAKPEEKPADGPEPTATISNLSELLDLLI